MKQNTRLLHGQNLDRAGPIQAAFSPLNEFQNPGAEKCHEGV